MEYNAKKYRDYEKSDYDSINFTSESADEELDKRKFS